MSKVPASLNFTDRDLTVSKINKVQAYEAMHAHIGQQKNLLRDQAKLLQKQLNAITRREELAEKIFQAKHNFVPVSVSFGKEDRKEDGRVVYAITMYISEGNQMAAVAETQTSADVCVLFRTYDIQVNPNLVKPGLNL